MHSVGCIVLLLAGTTSVYAQHYDEETTVGDSCRTLQNIQFRKEDAQPSELADELAYQCGDAATTVEIQYTANLRAVEPAKFLDTLLEPAVISSGQCPDRSAGTSAALRQLLHTLYPVQVMNIATDHTGGGNITEFIRITEGYTYPGDGGGVINEVTYVENQDKPSAMQYVESIPGLLTNGSTSLPKPVGADTKVFVADFKAPAPSTQAAFFFFATEMMNPCMWSTDTDVVQVPYTPGNGARTAACEGCAVHRGFAKAFDSITNTSDPRSNIAAAWTGMTGVPTEDVTRVLCSGFSLGAALATLCAPWAQATFPNAEVEVVTAGSPRVFNPAAAQWYDKSVLSNYRFVNNKDIIPSVPFANSGSLQYQHVGTPIFLDRTGGSLPGEYVAFQQERPQWYTGSFADHISGYILGTKQAMDCRIGTSS